MSVKSPRGPLLGAKRSVYLNELSRCATKSVMILHSSSSKVVRWTCILAFTGAYPSSLPVTLHSNGRMTYRPSLKEARGSQCFVRTCTSPWMDMAPPWYELAVPKHRETPKRRALEPAATKKRRHGKPLWAKQGENTQKTQHRQRAPTAAPDRPVRWCFFVLVFFWGRSFLVRVAVCRSRLKIAPHRKCLLSFPRFFF